MLNKYYVDSDLDSVWKKKERERFYSIFVNCRSIIIIEEYWTQTHRRVYHYEIDFIIDVM
jgi:hypothetical protein